MINAMSGFRTERGSKVLGISPTSIVFDLANAIDQLIIDTNSASSNVVINGTTSVSTSTTSTTIMSSNQCSTQFTLERVGNSLTCGPFEALLTNISSFSSGKVQIYYNGAYTTTITNFGGNYHGGMGYGSNLTLLNIPDGTTLYVGVFSASAHNQTAYMVMSTSPWSNGFATTIEGVYILSSSTSSTTIAPIINGTSTTLNTTSTTSSFTTIGNTTTSINPGTGFRTERGSKVANISSTSTNTTNSSAVTTAPTTITILPNNQNYTITFNETGLGGNFGLCITFWSCIPTWYVSLGSSSNYYMKIGGQAKSIIVFPQRLGVYAYNVTPPTGYMVISEVSPINFSSNVTVPVTFRLLNTTTVGSTNTTNNCRFKFIICWS